MEKQRYERPAVKFVGTFESMTQTTNFGLLLDDNFDGGPEVAGELSEA